MISKDKQYRTRDGREVRIYATDGTKNFEVHGAVKNDEGWHVISWGLDNGKFDRHSTEEHKYDLIEVKPRIKRSHWMNIYPSLCRDASHVTKDQADTHCGSDRIACVKVEIDCEEGEGLS